MKVEKPKSGWALGGVAIYAALVALLLVFLVFGIRIAEAIYPWALGIAALIFVLFIPFAVVCAFIPKARPLSALAFSRSSTPLFFTQWLACFIYAYHFSPTLCVFATLMGGIGVIPLSMGELAWNREWSSFPALFGTLAGCLVLKLLSVAVMAWHEKASAERAYA